MIIGRHPNFKKAYKKRIASEAKLVAKTARRIQMFMDNPHHPLLRDHALKGAQESLRAFWITGDIRVIYRREGDETVVFLDIGSHAQVY